MATISETAKARVAALKQKKAPSLLNAINAANLGPKTQNSAAVEERIRQEQALKKEVGGRK